MNQATTFFARLIGILIFTFFAHYTFAQQERVSVIRGTVKSGTKSLSYATVYLKDTQLSTSSDEDGSFVFHIPPGQHLLCVRYVGYETFAKAINIQSKEKQVLHIQLKETDAHLDEIIVEGKSPVKRINESAYNVVAINAKALRNTNLDIAHALDRVTGVKIREEGGVGSSAQISLNGFTGRHVKFFMDGMPLDASGDGFPINNIPLGVAERIEVYKGVVPVEFGSDALGGAINIVTSKSTNTFVDASYSFGSFNTHKSNLTLGYTTKNGITMQLNAYQNYSDNDYKVKIDEWLADVNSGLYSKEPKWFKRFHDRYHNEAVIAKVGVVKKTWADRLIFGLTHTQEHAELQNANIMTIVFGGIKHRTTNLSPSIEYEKRNLFARNLNVSLSARYDRNRINDVDTLARTYSWTGEYITKPSQGEATRTLAESMDKSGYITSNISYKISSKHFLSMNNIFSNFHRAETDKALSNSITIRESQKNVLGLSYKFAPNEKWNALAFTKYYYTHVKSISNNYSLTGYGTAATYYLNKDIQFKASFEKTYRLPTPKELFGDNSFEKGNANIHPENSQNLNLNVSFNHVYNRDHTLNIDAGFIYRNIRDFIKREIDNKGYGGSLNIEKVLSVGGEFEAHYFYKNKFSLRGNLTYQNMRNKEKSVTGNDNTAIRYNNRIPNIPYMFGNGDANFNFFNILKKGNSLSLGYTLHYIHKFHKEWQGEMGQMPISIPGQVSHDANVTYTLKNGRYNFAFEARDITNEILYDNFSLQKPGRSFTIKFRYFLFKKS